MGFKAALGLARPDPRATDRSRTTAGNELSVVALPAARAQPWREPRDPAPPRGRTRRHLGPDARTVWVYEPARVEGPLPVVVVLDGDVWVESQDLPTTLDNLIADGAIPPVLAALVDSGGRDRRLGELGEPAFADWLADRLLPWLRERWATGPAPADVVVAGQSLGGLTALQLGLRRPDVVGKVLAQSASLWRDDLADEVAAGSRQDLRGYVEVGTQEWVLREPNARLAQALGEAGADLTYVEYNGGHDYACWRGGLADGLRSLLGRR